MDFLIVGLGNPGPEYARTRHNVGAVCVERLARRWKAGAFRRTGSVRTAQVQWEQFQVVLGLPETFMNDSGRAIADCLGQWPIPLTRLMVVFDDVALPLGNLRVRPRGSAGGHKGLRSVIETLHDDGFARLRIGVGAENLPNALDRYVLAPFARQEESLLEQTLDQAMTVCELWMRQGVEAAMNRYNRKA